MSSPSQVEPECTCPYTDPSTWLSAFSCGYGSGYEPGSMQEWNPDCPVHGKKVEPLADYDARMCGATHAAIDNGAPCKYLAGHLDAGIPHTTTNGFWWAGPDAEEGAPRRRTEAEQRKCSEAACPGDGRYQPPGKGHLPGCQHDAVMWVWGEVTTPLPPVEPEHEWEPTVAPYGWCKCGLSFRNVEDWRDHVAESARDLPPGGGRDS